MYVIQGYGLKNAKDHLTEDFIKNGYDRKDGFNSSFGFGDTIGYYIGYSTIYPFEQPIFSSRKECEEELYKEIKPYLINKSMTKKEVMDLFEEYSDYGDI